MKHSDALGCGVSRETMERLGVYVELLQRWTRRLNLIAPGERDKIWERHVRDSLQLIPLMPRTMERAIDLGSGAGFPGLILAIATGLSFDLVEADRRKAAFLREAARLTQTAVTVHPCRAEQVLISNATLITARAMAPVPILLQLSWPLLAPGGVCLFLKGARVDAELEAAKAGWGMQVERFPSVLGQGGVVLRITEINRA